MVRHRIIARLPVLLAATTWLAGAAEGLELGIGPRVWYANNGQEAAWMGGGAGYAAGHGLELSALYLEGKYNNAGDMEQHRKCELLAGVGNAWAAAGVGFGYEEISTTLKSGWTWSRDWPEEKSLRNADIYGPLLRGVLRHRFTRWPFNVRAAMSCMPLDGGPLGDHGYDGAHWDAEGALGFALAQLQLEAGYRMERYRDLPDRDLEGKRYDSDLVHGPFVTLAVGWAF